MRFVTNQFIRGSGGTTYVVGTFFQDDATFVKEVIIPLDIPLVLKSGLNNAANVAILQFAITEGYIVDSSQIVSVAANPIYIPKVTTTNKNPFLAYSIPVGINKRYGIIVRVNASVQDFSDLYGGIVSKQFIRGTGNISSQDDEMRQTQGNLKVELDIVANTTTNSIDIILKGKDGVTIDWDLTLDVLFNYV